MSNSKHVSDSQIFDACKNSNTMRQASIKTGLHFNTFSKRAKKLGCYKPNQGSKGVKKPGGNKGFKLEDILVGKYPEYQTYKLRNRLIATKYLDYQCSECRISQWNNKELILELDHIDGNNSNHILSNLRLLCPNCHSQTSTYRGKNSKHIKIEP